MKPIIKFTPGPIPREVVKLAFQLRSEKGWTWGHIAREVHKRTDGLYKAPALEKAVAREHGSVWDD